MLTDEDIATLTEKIEDERNLVKESMLETLNKTASQWSHTEKTSSEYEENQKKALLALHLLLKNNTKDNNPPLWGRQLIERITPPTTPPSIINELSGSQPRQRSLSIMIEEEQAIDPHQPLCLAIEKGCPLAAQLANFYTHGLTETLFNTLQELATDQLSENILLLALLSAYANDEKFVAPSDPGVSNHFSAVSEPKQISPGLDATKRW